MQAPTLSQKPESVRFERPSKLTNPVKSSLAHNRNAGPVIIVPECLWIPASPLLSTLTVRRVALLIEPCVLPDDRDRVQRSTEARCETFGPRYFDRLPIVQGKRICCADPRVRLSIFIHPAIHNRLAAAKICCVNRRPHSTTDRVDRSSLNRKQCSLFASSSTEEVLVRCKQPGSASAFQRPATQRS